MDFQSYYVFNPRRMADLRIGASILKEALDRETEKEERAQRSRQERKAAEAAVARDVRPFLPPIHDMVFLHWRVFDRMTYASLSRQVKLAFLDDRKAKMLRDQRERELQGARQSARESLGASPPPASPPSSPVPMPGPGHTLAAVDQTDPDMDQPPPYPD